MDETEPEASCFVTLLTQGKIDTAFLYCCWWWWMIRTVFQREDCRNKEIAWLFCGTGNHNRRPRATVRSGIIQRFTLSTVVVVTTKFHYISSVNDDNGKNLDTVFWGLGLAEIVLRLFLFWYVCSQSQYQMHRFHNFTSSIYSTVSLIHTYIHTLFATLDYHYSNA